MRAWKAYFADWEGLRVWDHGSAWDAETPGLNFDLKRDIGNGIGGSSSGMKGLGDWGREEEMSDETREEVLAVIGYIGRWVGVKFVEKPGVFEERAVSVRAGVVERRMREVLRRDALLEREAPGSIEINGSEQEMPSEGLGFRQIWPLHVLYCKLVDLRVASEASQHRSTKLPNLRARFFKEWSAKWEKCIKLGLKRYDVFLAGPGSWNGKYMALRGEFIECLRGMNGTLPTGVDLMNFIDPELDVVDDDRDMKGGDELHKILNAGFRYAEAVTRLPRWARNMDAMLAQWEGMKKELGVEVVKIAEDESTQGPRGGESSFMKDESELALERAVGLRVVEVGATFETPREPLRVRPGLAPTKEVRVPHLDEKKQKSGWRGIWAAIL